DFWDEPGGIDAEAFVGYPDVSASSPTNYPEEQIMTRIKQIEPGNWREFLEEFSVRNNNRRARFQVFRGATSTEEGEEAYLEDVSLKENDGETEVVVVRIDRGGSKAEKTHQTITNVRRIAVQFDTDGSEDALEIIDKENELVVLRMESRVDGAS